MFSTETLLRAVPHRFPFLFIDKIVEQEYNVRAVCLKNVSLSEEVFVGHFPGNPIYPGVLMVEMGLQTTQIALTNLEPQDAQVHSAGAEQGFLIQINKFQFFKPVKPGTILYIEAKIQGSAMGMFRSEISIVDENKEKVASGTVSVGGAKERT